MACRRESVGDGDEEHGVARGENGVRLFSSSKAVGSSGWKAPHGTAVAQREVPDTFSPRNSALQGRKFLFFWREF